MAGRAAGSEVRANEIADGADGNSSYLVDIPSGGSLIMTNNLLEKGPKSSNPTTAIMLNEETRARPIGVFILSGNRFRKDTGGTTIFVRNWTRAEVKLEGNILEGHTTALSSDGYFLHQLRVWSSPFVMLCKTP